MMTPILLPLVMSLVSLGVSEPSFQPSAAIWDEFAGSRYLPRVDTGTLATAGYSEMLALSGGAYPEAYRLNPDEALAAPVELSVSAAQVQALADRAYARAAEIERQDEPDSDFDMTRGVGLVGVGFVWRYR